MVSILFDILSYGKICIAPNKSWKKYFETVRKGYQKMRNFVLFSKCIKQKGEKCTEKQIFWGLWGLYNLVLGFQGQTKNNLKQSD